jgi:oligoribonuclease (3'-5' exoribonuclease)
VADSATNNLVWIDCEMTGLDLVKDKLIEVAVVVTDSQLNVLDPGLDVIIHAEDASSGMSRARKPRSVPIELPHSGAVRRSGTKRLT